MWWQFWKRKLTYSNREYGFHLPYYMPASTVFYAIPMLKKEGIFQKLPKELQDRMTKARDKWFSLKITKEDLDKVDDDSWKAIAGHLGLGWKKV